MFLTFFYLLRQRGFRVSLNEWLSLLDALDKGLCSADLVDFYYLCRNVLVKSEADYDKFDLIFAEYFEGVETPPDIRDEVWTWLDEELRREGTPEELTVDGRKYSLDELRRMLEERLEEQKEKHQGGNYWIGTGGTSVMGHGGYNTQGIRIGGSGQHRSAVQIAQQRDFRDFRQDAILDTRQFQMAFRKLRQFSTRSESRKTELAVEDTVQATCENGGNLKLVFERPRKNMVKLLLLFDSEGSMWRHSRLCSSLFQAVDRSSHFKDLKVYYFHNCVYQYLYTTPECRKNEWVETEWVLSNLDSDYKVIVIGDASMAPSELMNRGGSCYRNFYNEDSGLDWLYRFKRGYQKLIWLNPIPEQEWDYAYGYYTIAKIRDVIPMYELSLNGLESGIKKLLVNR